MIVKRMISAAHKGKYQMLWTDKKTRFFGSEVKPGTASKRK